MPSLALFNRRMPGESPDPPFGFRAFCIASALLFRHCAVSSVILGHEQTLVYPRVERIGALHGLCNSPYDGLNAFCET